MPVALAQRHDELVRIDIPAGDLADALDALSDRSGMQIMYQPRLVGGIRVAALDGWLTVRDALGQLLAHTGIRADRVNERTVVLKAVEGFRQRPPSDREPTQH